MEFTAVSAGYGYVLFHFSGSYSCYVNAKLSQLQPIDAPDPQKCYYEHQAGGKIAVCGASGSGKTSLLMAMLHMLDLQSGSISIDGEDLAGIPRSTIRSRINVIPQDPFFMPGTLRFNLDPRQCVIDTELIRAVEKVGLGDRVHTEGGLDMEFTPKGGWIWSSQLRTGRLDRSNCLLCLGLS